MSCLRQCFLAVAMPLFPPCSRTSTSTSTTYGSAGAPRTAHHRRPVYISVEAANVTAAPDASRAWDVPRAADTPDLSRGLNSTPSHTRPQSPHQDTRARQEETGRYARPQAPHIAHHLLYLPSAHHPSISIHCLACQNSRHPCSSINSTGRAAQDTGILYLHLPTCPALLLRSTSLKPSAQRPRHHHRRLLAPVHLSLSTNGHHPSLAPRPPSSISAVRT